MTAALRRDRARRTTTEYAIQLGDGSLLATGWNTHIAQFVQTWTVRAQAEMGLARVKACGISLGAGGKVTRDPRYCNADLVQREVTPWTSATADGSAPVEPPPPAPGADHPTVLAW
jgi:hypothetical protein